MSVHKLGKDRYKIDIYLGRDSDTGKRMRDVFTFNGALKAAQAEERRLLRERDLGTYVSPSSLTVAEYLDRWLPSHVESKKLAGTTKEGYERVIKLHIKPHVGTILLPKLRPLHIQNMYAALLNRPEADGGKLSGHTVLHVHRLLNQALAQAVRWRDLAINPCAAVEPPRKDKKQMASINEAETARLLHGLEGTRYYAPVLVAVSCGLRRGELLGLRWQDVNLKDSTLWVRQALEQTKEGLKFKTPKTEESTRKLALARFVVVALKAHRAEQAARRLEQGNTYHDHDLVFPLPDGNPWSPSHFSRMFHHHAKRLGVSCRLHDLRHSHATQMLRAGVDVKTISTRLGHSTVAFTLDTYAHAVDELDRTAAKRVGTALENALRKQGKR